jgi:hypothetical protein
MRSRDRPVTITIVSSDVLHGDPRMSEMAFCATASLTYDLYTPFQETIKVLRIGLLHIPISSDERLQLGVTVFD